MNERIRELAEQAGAYFGERLEHSVIFDELDDFEKFAELIVRECADNLVQSNMSNPEYARAMDAYYEQKWAHRFD